MKVTVSSKLPPPGRQASNAASVQLALVPVPTTHAKVGEVVEVVAEVLVDVLVVVGRVVVLVDVVVGGVVVVVVDVVVWQVLVVLVVVAAEATALAS